MNTAFWKDKRVLLTGHSGFKGSWLSLWLKRMGARVVGYSLEPPTNPSLFDIAKISQGMVSILGDIRDLEKLRATLVEHKPEIVIHMAAQALVRHSYSEPLDTYSTNVLGTVNLLEAVRITDSVRSVVIITSDKCYENREWVWGYRESDAMGGLDPYSSSKGCAELVVAAYRNSFFNPYKYQNHRVGIASARAGNVIGGGDWGIDRLIPDIINSLVKEKSVIIRNPKAVRPWQHVLEPLSGYLVLAQKLYEYGVTYAEGWNFGPNDEDARSVQWIVEKMTMSWGGSKQWILNAKDHLHESQQLKLDSTKAHARLNWYPRWHLEYAIEKILEWQKSYLKGENMNEVSLEQIESYMKAKTV